MKPCHVSNQSSYDSNLCSSIVVQHHTSHQAHDAAFHFHADYEIFLFLGGDVDFYTENAVCHLKRGHMIVCNDRELHRACHYGALPYERMAIHFDHHLIEGLSTTRTNLLGCFHVPKSEANLAVLLNEEQIKTVLFLGRKLQDLSASDEFGSDVLTLSYLSELLVFVNARFRQMQPSSALAYHGLVAEVIAYIDGHLTSELSLESISHAFSIDKYYLSHLFQNQTGSSLYHYILIKKVALAKLFLSQGRSVTETCEQSGFYDYNNFIRTFKKITGTSPGKYKKSYTGRL